MAYNNLDDMDLNSKRVLVRVDINVPMKDGQVTDATRIEKIAPTVRDILAKGGTPILLAHFGRPKGTRTPSMSLEPLTTTIEKHVGAPVIFVADCIGAAPAAAIEAAPSGTVILCENTRFHPEEEKNDPEFAKAMAALGDIYCNDAFSAAHRAHASTEGVARLLPACAGRLMEAELKALDAALGAPERPVAAVVGGAKVSTKLDLLKNLIHKVDHLIIGGGMANTFLAAQGIDIGKSLAEHDLTDTANEIMTAAADAGCAILLPTDVVIAREFAANADHDVVAADACPADAMILDAGQQTVVAIHEVLAQSKTLIWNGPLGAFEIEPFDMATVAAARAAAELTASEGLISVAGGGDTVAALNHAGVAPIFSYISTAGGAFLEWMEGKTLPGVAALEQK